MSNAISFTGRLGRDAELKTVGDNDVLEFSVASDCGFGKNKATNWFRCTVWGNRAAKLVEFLTKGKQVAVFGDLKLREYEKKDGGAGMSADVRVNEIDLMGSNEDKPTSPQAPESTDSDDDEVPF